MTEKTRPKANSCLSGTTANQSRDERRRARSQKKAERMRTMTRTGSLTTVKTKSAKGGPKAVRAQPKKVHAVISAQRERREGRTPTQRRNSKLLSPRTASDHWPRSVPRTDA